jgi:hypothetical protein
VWQKKTYKFFYKFFLGLENGEQKKSHHIILCKITQGIKIGTKRQAQKCAKERERERARCFRAN